MTSNLGHQDACPRAPSDPSDTARAPATGRAPQTSQHVESRGLGACLASKVERAHRRRHQNRRGRLLHPERPGSAGTQAQLALNHRVVLLPEHLVHRPHCGLSPIEALHEAREQV
jgi:hypothetical protein